jgi:hypothetical protein
MGDWSVWITAAASFFGAGIGAVIGALVTRRGQRELARLREKNRIEELYFEFLDSCREIENICERVQDGQCVSGVEDARKLAWNSFSHLKVVCSADLEAAAYEFLVTLVDLSWNPPRDRKVWEVLAPIRKRLEDQGVRDLRAVH